MDFGSDVSLCNYVQFTVVYISGPMYLAYCGMVNQVVTDRNYQADFSVTLHLVLQNISDIC